MREEEGNQKRKGKAVAILRNLPRIKRKETRKAALEIKNLWKIAWKVEKYIKSEREIDREREKKRKYVVVRQQQQCLREVSIAKSEERDESLKKNKK